MHSSLEIVKPIREEKVRNSSINVRTEALQELKEMIPNSGRKSRTYKMTVSEMVKSSKKCNDEFGIEGYDNVYSRFHPWLDKPTVFSHSKD